jgi:exonuclease SbcC
MKFLKIEVENIASLKGKHVIDFSTIYETSSLFAITGDTGSGKSTLLNAISLSLYGQNYKKTLTQLDFITLNESYGSTSLELEIENKRYRFNWSCRIRKKSGELLKTPKPKREYFQWKSNNWEVIEKNSEEIIQLSFEQFCKTIILNQGDFAKFLTSSFKERKDILEKFYEGFNLDILSIKNRQKLNTVKEKINLIESKISGFDQSNTEGLDKDKLSNDIKLLKEKNKNIKNSIEESSSNKQHLIDILKTRQLIKTSQDRKSRIETENKQATSQLNIEKKLNKDISSQLLKMKKSYSTEEPRLLEAIKMKQQVENIDKDFKKTLSELAHIEKTLLELKSSIAKNKDEQKELLASTAKLVSKIKKSFDLALLEKLLKELEESSSQYDLTAKDVKNLESKLLDITTSANEKKEKISVSQQKSIAIDEAQIKKKIKNEEASIIKISSLSKEIEKKKADLRKLQSEQTVSKKQKTTLLKTQQSSERLLKEIIEKTDLYKDRIELNQLQQAKIKCIEHTLKENSCVICGNVNLTELKSPSNSTDTEMATISMAKEKILELDEQKLSTIKEIEKNKAQLEHLEITSSKNKSLIDDVKNELSESGSMTEIEKRLLSAQKSSETLRSELTKKTLLEETIKENESDLQIYRDRYKETNELFLNKNGNLTSLKKNIDLLQEKVNKLTGTELTLKSLQEELQILRSKFNIQELLTEKEISLAELEKSNNNHKENTKKKQNYSAELIKTKDLINQKVKEITDQENPEVTLSYHNGELEKVQHKADLYTKSLT